MELNHQLLMTTETLELTQLNISRYVLTLSKEQVVTVVHIKPGLEFGFDIPEGINSHR